MMWIVLRLACVGGVNALTLLWLPPLSDRVKGAEILAFRHRIMVLEWRLPGGRPRILREYDMPPELGGRGLRHL